MTVPVFVVDAFSESAFGGNPAGVCLLPDPAGIEWMQAVAAEMKHSETAFLERRADGWGLRWFTPAAEVKLCGHATLASAHVLWETGALESGQIAVFHTLSGRLAAQRCGGEIELDFPAKPALPAPAPPGLLDALGAHSHSISRSEFDYLVELESPATLRALQPDFARLSALPVRGVIVTSLSDDPQFDFLSRFFAPAVGVNEDPVTGSAHCSLGPFWQARLGRDELLAWQASPRGGRVRVSVRGDRVGLGGRAVTVLRGKLTA
ncbi:MAG: PhzF family phenazine biosynthesis protein [Verrucomicrobiota bacterium]|jgi:predicted PhzF superfamily epimerase YddE/YHI9